MGHLENVRHAEERGKILKVLQEESAGRLTRVGSLRSAVDLLGYPLTDLGMQFHLQYLADEGYIRVERACDAPGYRRDRIGAGDPNTIVWVRLMPKGTRLIDGIEQENPGVRF